MVRTASMCALMVTVAALVVALRVQGESEVEAAGSTAARAGCGSLRIDPASPQRWVALPGAGDLEVWVEGASTAVAGRMATGLQNGRVFRPAFAFKPGLRYRVRGGNCSAVFEVPVSLAPTPEVVAVYPRTAELPENVLRFYLYFSEPMADGGFLNHVRLEHVETKEDLTGVFFDNIHELWSRDRKRITLLVDPGRVKTGLEANRRLGRAFVAGQTYRFVVLPSWKSLQGVSLAQPFTMTYRARSEDRQPVDVHAWRLTLPSAGTHDALAVDFGKAVDHVSLHHLLHVLTPQGTPARGGWILHPSDRMAQWVPERSWQHAVGDYALRIQGRFEDIAGNNLSAAFDHSAGEVQARGEDHLVTRLFRGQPPSQ